MNLDGELPPVLDRLGQETAPPPDPAFAARLDAHLRTMHVEQADRRNARPASVPVLAGLAGLVAVAVVFASLSLLGGKPAVVVMTAAAETEVVLPGAAATPGAAGQELPDGARVVVGSDGEAVVGGVFLGPGAEAIVVGGRLEVLVGDGEDHTVSPPSPSPGPVPTTTGQPAPTDTPATTSEHGRPDGSASSTTVRPPDPTVRRSTASAIDDPVTAPTMSGGDPATTSTPATAPLTTTSTPSTTLSTTPGSALDSVTTSRPRPEPSIEVTVDAQSADRIVLRWVLDHGGSPARWRIEAVAGDRVSVLAVLRDGSARTIAVARIDAAGVGFRVVALRPDGSDLVASEVVLQPPPLR